MEFKEYQQAVLDAFDHYLAELMEKRGKVEAATAALEQAGADASVVQRNWPEQAWEELRRQGRLPALRKDTPYTRRIDGLGGEVPSVCLKIPTGGGKTLLAASSSARIVNVFHKRNTGLILWLVPNEAIYTQTRKQLVNREHPYRQILDKAGAGRVKILEKNDPLRARDVQGNLCVLLLMLPSANRRERETLKMFRDRGNVYGFFPALDDLPAHEAVLGRIPNLDVYGRKDQIGAIVKDSLGNVLRAVRPVVVVDEGHKAMSKLAFETIYGFNPSFVLELSATPKDRRIESTTYYSNWLVDVRGQDLEREEMIKLPINLKVKAGDDWHAVLRESWEHTQALRAEADKLRSNSARYIRPIMLVQVERTGREQRETGFIHAEDAREYLLSLGLAEREIAIKTAEVNELNDPENMDLLAETCPVGVIITKQALQEGWDCPFAYTLCSLAANSNLTAMVQLIGRIMRQPHALKTGNPRLDECYVFCHHVSTGQVVEKIKEGLESDGMGDLVREVRVADDGGGASSRPKRRIERRDRFKKARIFFPKVLWIGNGTPRPLDYESDVVSRIDWNMIDGKAMADGIADVRPSRSMITRIDLGIMDDDRHENLEARVSTEPVSFDPVYATRSLSDLVPNPWVAREIVASVSAGLIERGWNDEKLGSLGAYVIDEVRKAVSRQKDAVAEDLFISSVNDGSIQFRLRTDGLNWELPKEIFTDLPEGSRVLLREKSDGKAVENSLFWPEYRDEYNGLEAEFACYLDEDKAMKWWHRNVAKGNNYGLQGWRKNRVYPDFIFALQKDDGGEKLVALETKGDHLAGNLDTTYKRKLLEILTRNFAFENVTKAGELEVEFRPNLTLVCDLVLGENWKTSLHEIIAS